jgi:hypothetical protein
MSGYNATGSGDAATSDRMPADDPCLGFALSPSGTYANLETTLYHQEVFGSGHGTAVASLVGGNQVGVAKRVAIVPIKVIRCDRFSARTRIGNHDYALNETMIRPQSTTSAGPLYRAIQPGRTQINDPGNWPTTASATKQDGGVLWQVVPQTQWNNAQTTNMMIDGLNWIIDPNRNTAGPRSRAIVSISTGRVPTTPGWAGPPPSVEAAIETLLSHNMTVIASANNQNGDACDTTPARMSDGNPDAARRKGVVTVAGTMLFNRPWSVDLTDVPGATEPSPENRGTPDPTDRYGPEPPYDQTKPVRDSRWICGPGDSSQFCNNINATASPDPQAADIYHTWQGGSSAGPCVTLLAPAKNIPVASVTAANGYRDPRIRDAHASGTSWSAPIVAGAAAHIVQGFLTSNPGFTRADVQQALLAKTVAALDPTTLNTYDYSGNLISGTPNRLLRLGDVAITSGPTGTSSPSGTVLAVAAVGNSLAYEWYRVNSNFDPTAFRGAHPTLSSTFVGTGSSYTVQTAGRYWVRVTGSCGSADSDIVSATAPPPSNFSGGATDADTIRLVWSTPIPNATYRIRFRNALNAEWTDIVETADTSYYHDGRTRGTLYQYEVLLKTPGGDMSPPVTDYALALTFQNDPINPPNTPRTRIRGIHVGELREAADGWRAFLGSLPDAFPSYGALSGRVSASHWASITAALDAARAGLGLAPFAYAGVSAPAPAGRIRREHVQQLRDAMR